MLQRIFTYESSYTSRRIFAIYREAMTQSNKLVFVPPG